MNRGRKDEENMERATGPVDVENELERELFDIFSTPNQGAAVLHSVRAAEQRHARSILHQQIHGPL